MSSRQEGGEPKKHVRDAEGSIQTEVVPLPEIPFPHYLPDKVPPLSYDPSFYNCLTHRAYEVLVGGIGTVSHFYWKHLAQCQPQSGC